MESIVFPFPGPPYIQSDLIRKSCHDIYSGWVLIHSQVPSVLRPFSVMSFSLSSFGSVRYNAAKQADCSCSDDCNVTENRQYRMYLYLALRKVVENMGFHWQSLIWILGPEGYQSANVKRRFWKEICLIYRYVSVLESSVHHKSHIHRPRCFRHVLCCGFPQEQQTLWPQRSILPLVFVQAEPVLITLVKRTWRIPIQKLFPDPSVVIVLRLMIEKNCRWDEIRTRTRGSISLVQRKAAGLRPINGIGH